MAAAGILAHARGDNENAVSLLRAATSLDATMDKPPLIGSAQAAEAAGFTFLQISDSHVGFDKKANPARYAAGSHRQG